MPRGIRVKPSKPASLFGMIVGIVFVFIGLFVAIPSAGMFGVFWTLIAVGITGFQAYNFFGDKGVASWEIDIDTGANAEMKNQSISVSGDFETRLRKLNRLKEDGLITEEEFQKKREEILREKW
ncbi:SHOCT domain-containing protein [Petroclostridium xylanilyticum]|uniref:SHOCT domain-containing protein n=1 Tax=Petroclostridium xylanilyticum TaxID=1792311 RepID=UPI000B986DFF|nr:SHOCT domain-containing protein [Petroclostridium xylanilyticum]